MSADRDRRVAVPHYGAGVARAAAVGEAPLLSSCEAAAMLGLRPQTLRKWRVTGRGPRFVRLGGPAGRVVYRMAHIEEWLEEHTFANTSAERVAADQAG